MNIIRLFVADIKSFIQILFDPPEYFMKEICKMTNLKRTYIELVKNPEEVIKGGEPEIEKVWTPAFIPWRTVRQALQTLTEAEETSSEMEVLEKMENFVANEIYNGQITVDDLGDRLHGPVGIKTLRDVIQFVSYGAQEESNEKKGSPAKKR